MRKIRFLVVLALLFGVGIAQGQTAASIPECAEHPACKLLFDQAQQQSGSGQLVDALRSYKLAYEVTPDPRLLYSIARVLHKQNQTVEATPYYRQFLATTFTKPADEAQKVIAQEFLAQCEAVQRPPVQEPPITPPPNPSVSTAETKPVPVYKKWWFWTVIGGVAAAAAVGVGVGMGVGVPSREPDLSGVMQYRPFHQ